MGRELGIGGGGALESPGMRTRVPELVPRGAEEAGAQVGQEGHYVELHGLPDNFDHDFGEMLASV